MRRIAYVANSRIPSRQANTAHVLNMSAAFAQAGNEVTLIARGEPAAVEHVVRDFDLPSAFDLRLLPRRGPRMFDRLNFVRHVRSAFREVDFDLAYGRSRYGLLTGVPDDVPMAIDLHVFPSERSQQMVESRLFRRGNFLFATAITGALRDKYEAVYPKLRGRILLAPCAAKLPDATLLKTGSRDTGPVRVYYVGHLYPGRGIDLILAVAELESGIEFHIVGGEESDIAFWKSQAPPNVTFHGYVRPAELPAHYRRADLCIAPHGTRVAAAGGGGGDIAPWMSPMKIFEYMSYGKAFVAADLPVIREVIAPGIEGLLCLPGDVQAWRSAVRLLAADSELRARLGRSARMKAEREFTWERRAENILEMAERFSIHGAGGRSVARTA